MSIQPPDVQPSNVQPTLRWQDANQASLAAALAEVRRELEAMLQVPAAGLAVEAQSAPDSSEGELDRAVIADRPMALDALATAFGLSSFERKILLLCAGVEMDSRFGSLLRQLVPPGAPAMPTFSLALATFAESHWSAILPGSPLRNWRLIELPAGESLTTRPLRIDERILHSLAGLSTTDERLHGLSDPIQPATELPASHRALAEQGVRVWSQTEAGTTLTVIQLSGSEFESKRDVASRICEQLGLRLRSLPAFAIPRSLVELDLYLQLWDREVALDPCALLLQIDGQEAADPTLDAAVRRILETVRGPLLLSVRDRFACATRRLLTLEVSRPDAQEQCSLWTATLNETAQLPNGAIGRLAAQFRMSLREMQSAVTEVFPENGWQATASNVPEQAKQLEARLWQACRLQARPRLDGLAQRIATEARWDDLVLPTSQKRLLVEIAIHVRNRSKVYDEWGFSSRGARGLGISALFAGPSGTGKTMAGEVLANELGLDLYRIDLSEVVSKYIGETEKNLRRVFDAAEGSAAILLFDEADALFGKRSEVKDSHDRYANIEVSYLLQRMEGFSGLAVLTTNSRDSLDPAFLRRLRFVVEFPFPEAAQRAEIWRRIFPRKTPTEGLDYERLARLSASGGNIRNIALGAAFLAADAGEPVRMTHLLSAAQGEFTKMEQPLGDFETAGWR